MRCVILVCECDLVLNEIVKTPKVVRSRWRSFSLLCSKTEILTWCRRVSQGQGIKLAATF